MNISSFEGAIFGNMVYPYDLRVRLYKLSFKKLLFKIIGRL